MRVDVLTLFPAAFTGPLDVSIIRRARDAGLLDLQLHDIREHATGRHRSVDDYPFGGGPGMVMRVDVLDRALTSVQGIAEPSGLVVYPSPAGERLTDSLVRELAAGPRLVIVCGRYEGVDERFVEHCVDREISIGDYVVTGGELPAMVLIDAVARHIPGALGDSASPEEESFAEGLLEHPQYTRPAAYRGWTVPAPLLAGDHGKIAAWQRSARVVRTRARRPDLLPPSDSTWPAEARKPRGAAAALRTFHYPEDYPAVRALWESASLPHGPSDEPLAIAKKLARDPELFIVAEAGKTLVGAVLGGFDGRRGVVYRLAVREDYRRRGIARRLAGELATRLTALGCTRAEILIAPGNAAVELFLAAEGWTPRGVSAWHKDT